MSHPIHPKCPSCGKALFKSYKAAKVRPADPYRFCRNEKCTRCGPSGITPSPEPGPSRGMKELTDKDATKRLAKSKAAQKVTVTPPEPKPERPPTRAKRRTVSAAQPEKPGEPPAVAKARARIRALLESVTKDAPKVSVGLVLAILNQETGNHKAANQLIDDFKLDQVFGLERFAAQERA